MTTRTLHEATADLNSGRVVRVRLIRGTDGTPEELYLAEGWASGGEDHRRKIGPLPGHALGELIQALQALHTPTQETT